ncbi:MAG TPA: aspartyl protease family protein [Candidatus Baltobacteraceae bacterium]|nr:aspartyl protease family protein [Candidatus Baltobacteraceae bacterium]
MRAILVRGLAIAAILTASTAVTSPPMPLATVHFEPNGKLIFLPVTIEHRGLWFSLDSGAMHSVIDTATARRVGLHIVAQGRMAGAGHGTVPLERASPLDLDVGGVALHVSDPYVIDLSHTGTARRQDGLIGQDFLEAYVVRIDPVGRTFIIYAPSAFRYTGTGAALPLTVRHEKLYIPMTLVLSNGLRAVREARIDTGSEDAASDDLVRRSPERRESVVGVGLGHSYVDYSGVFERVVLGPYTIAHAWGPANPVPTVGMEILRRFTLTFDVPHRRLYLEPNAHLHDPVPTPPPG